jgi:hypothetical protein
MILPYFHGIRQVINRALDEAMEEICVAVYWFTNHELFNKLCAKLTEGKRVSLIVHNDYINNREGGLAIQSFIDLGGLFYFSDSANPMHNKFCIIDNKTLINGSYNWTYYAEDRNSENILIISEDQVTVSAFRAQFLQLTEQLKRVEKVQPISKFEIDAFSDLGTRDYLANDIIQEAKSTNRPDLIEAAFKLAPENIKIQRDAVSFSLKKEKKILCSIGGGIKDNNYLVGIPKGTITPVSITKELATIQNDQLSCSCTLYSGDNKIASLNKQMPNQGLNKHPGGVIVRDIPPKPAGEAKLRIIFSIDIYGQLKVRFYSLDNGSNDLYWCDINSLLADI